MNLLHLKSIRRSISKVMADSSAPLIAVIEDEAPIQKFLQASLQIEGFRIVCGEHS